MTKNDLKNHTWITTDDGSLTLFSEKFQEACHSTAGARAETLVHYIDGCRIREKNPLKVLEVGFGLGVGFLTTLEVLRESQTKWHFLSVELDPDLLNWFKETRPELNLTWNANRLETTTDFYSLTVLCGNARETLPRYLATQKYQWNAIYQDAFSPKKNPILWTKEWFEFLKEHSSPDVTLSTYSASAGVRKSLVEAGWKIRRGEKFGAKKTSTRAGLVGESDEDILQQLERSPVTPLRDSDVKEHL